MIWFLNQYHTENERGFPVTFTDSRRWRFSGSTKWNPAMLSDYAAYSGIKLAGIRSFKEAFLQQRADKREAQAQKAAKVIPAAKLKHM